MSMQKKAKKRLILSSAAIVLAAGLGVGGWLFWQYRNDQKTVEVQPVSYLSTATGGTRPNPRGPLPAITSRSCTRTPPRPSPTCSSPRGRR